MPSAVGHPLEADLVTRRAHLARRSRAGGPAPLPRAAAAGRWRRWGRRRGAGPAPAPRARVLLVGARDRPPQVLERLALDVVGGVEADVEEQRRPRPGPAARRRRSARARRRRGRRSRSAPGSPSRPCRVQCRSRLSSPLQEGGRGEGLHARDAPSGRGGRRSRARRGPPPPRAQSPGATIRSASP